MQMMWQGPGAIVKGGNRRFMVFVEPPLVRGRFLSKRLRHNRKRTHVLMYGEKTIAISEANVRTQGALRNQREPSDG